MQKFARMVEPARADHANPRDLYVESHTNRGSLHERRNQGARRYRPLIFMRQPCIKRGGLHRRSSLSAFVRFGRQICSNGLVRGKPLLHLGRTAAMAHTQTSNLQRSFTAGGTVAAISTFSKEKCCQTSDLQHRICASQTVVAHPTLARGKSAAGWTWSARPSRTEWPCVRPGRLGGATGPADRCGRGG